MVHIQIPDQTFFTSLPESGGQMNGVCSLPYTAFLISDRR